MTSPVYAKLAARFLAREASNELPVVREDRWQSIAVIERALREKARRKRRMRWAVGVAVAAAALLVASFVAIPKRQTPSVAAAQSTAKEDAPSLMAYAVDGDVSITSGGSNELGQGKTLAQGSRVASKSGARALLASSRGTRLTLESESELSVEAAGREQIFALHQGALQAKVSKLAQGERFVVRTSDAEVEVRGTAFRVSLAASDPNCGDGVRTRVNVQEGVVVVRHANAETAVTAGRVWPDCTASAAPVNAARSRPASVSNLAELNDQFAAAIAAKRSGQTSLAITRFERFIAAYPRSALAESAEVERMKLLAVSNPTRAAAAARAYLAAHPRGFARVEAEALALGKK